MREACELSFCELRAKEVVNSVDGRRLGRIIDLIFSSSGGAICGIVVPYSRKISLFKSQDVFIPWTCVKKIGEDVIIVELTDFCGKPSKKNEPIRCAPPKEEPPACSSETERECEKPPAKQTKNPSEPNCDRRCEKCMLFDCEYRWDSHTDFASGNGPGVYLDKNYNGGSNGRL